MFSLLAAYADTILVGPFLLIFIVSGIITILSRGVQFRSLSLVGAIIKQSFHPSTHSQEELPPLSSLAMSLSTTIGIGNIVGPLVAIGYGGPGTLVGFMLGTVLGGATTFAEASLSIIYRSKRPDGSIAGGPMSYLGTELGNTWAWIYAFFGLLLLASWSSSQSNNLAILLASHGMPLAASGVILAGLLLFVMLSGVQFIGEMSKILVPIMFLLYSGSTLWIIIQNAHKLPEVFTLVLQTFFSPQTALGATAGIGMSQVIRWGFARAIQTDEIGTGTTAFPHSISSAEPHIQATLATVALYMNGILCLLSGLCILVTDFWKTPGCAFDITLFGKILAQYYGPWGHIILIACACMFAFGTIVGNCYNGSQCFLFVTKNRWLTWYYYATCCAVLLGAITDMSIVWGIVDYFVIPVAVPHIIGILYIAYKHPSIFNLTSKSTVNAQEGQ